MYLFYGRRRVYIHKVNLFSCFVNFRNFIPTTCSNKNCMWLSLLLEQQVSWASCTTCSMALFVVLLVCCVSLGPPILRAG